MNRSESAATDIGAVMVTGASGYIGAATALSLARRGVPVVAVGGTAPLPHALIDAGCTPARVELRDPLSITALNQHQCRAIIHCAALSRPAQCELDPQGAQAANVTALPHLFAAVAGAHRPVFIFLSTDLVFDGNPAAPSGFKETDLPTPISVYARTKYEGERLVLAASTISGVVLRIALTYGSKIENLEGVMAPLWRSAATGDPAPLFVDEFRTPLFIDDLSEAIARLLTGECAELPAEQRTFHLGGPERLSRHAMGLIFADVYGIDTRLMHPTTRDAVAAPPRRPEDVSLTSERIVSRLALVRHTVREAFTEMAATPRSPV